MDHFKDIRYNDALTYGELFMQNEYEMSMFNMDLAGVEDHKTRHARQQKHTITRNNLQTSLRFKTLNPTS